MISFQSLEIKNYYHFHCQHFLILYTLQYRENTAITYRFFFYKN